MNNTRYEAGYKTLESERLASPRLTIVELVHTRLPFYARKYRRHLFLSVVATRSAMQVKNCMSSMARNVTSPLKHAFPLVVNNASTTFIFK